MNWRMLKIFVRDWANIEYMNKTLQILDITTTTVDTDLYNITAINRKRDPYWVEFIQPYFQEIEVDIKILSLDKIDLKKN